MSIGWKILIPTALAYIVIVAAVVLGLDAARIPRGFVYGGILFAVNAVLLVVMFLILDRGRIVSPAYRGTTATDLARLRAAAAARAHLSTQAGD
jgi:hypothetical protein